MIFMVPNATCRNTARTKGSGMQQQSVVAVIIGTLKWPAELLFIGA
jgi:hypothetical protein